MLRRLLMAAAVAAAGLAGIQVPALAQGASAFPSKPITLIIPFIPGLTADLLFRGIAESASKHLGQPVIIDNKPGGSATLGPATMANNAKPDGYTIAQLAIPVYRVPYMQKASFDPVKDFTYIILLGGYSLGAVVMADGPFKKWQDVIEFAKANPGKFTYATVGPATTNAIAMELMARQSGVQFTHIPTKGGGKSLAAVLGGHVMMMVESPAWAPMVAVRSIPPAHDARRRAQQEVARRADPEGARLHLRVRTRPSVSPAPRAWTPRSSRSCTMPSRKPTRTRKSSSSTRNTISPGAT